MRRRVLVHGRVQGVWFRASTREVARREQVAGWVRNCRDGSVEAVFEGPGQAVEALVAFCRTGPRGARVDRVEVFEEETEGLRDFAVRS